MFILTGRRLKRFLGFVRKQEKILGEIDFLSLAYITGWIYSSNYDLDQIKLKIGNQYVSTCFIDIDRQDVRDKYNTPSKVGFKLNLPTSIERLISQDEINVYAISSDKKFSFDLLSAYEKKGLSEDISVILNSNLLALDGHIDGICDLGIIRGWCSKRGASTSYHIWLQNSSGDKAIKILCNESRSSLVEFGYYGKSSFTYDTEDLLPRLKNNKIWFSFDEEGKFIVPQTNDIFLDKSFFDTEFDFDLLRDSTNLSYENEFFTKFDNCLSDSDFINLSKEEYTLDSEWQELLELKNYLDSINLDNKKISTRKILLLRSIHIILSDFENSIIYDINSGQELIKSIYSKLNELDKSIN